MSTGVVKWFNSIKGYGFIHPDNKNDKGGDVFVHISSLPKNLKKDIVEGDRVSYELSIPDNKGRISAVNVNIIED